MTTTVSNSVMLDETGQQIVAAIKKLLGTTDPSLSAQGTPADARATGERLKILENKVQALFTIAMNIFQGTEIQLATANSLEDMSIANPSIIYKYIGEDNITEGLYKNHWYWRGNKNWFTDIDQWNDGGLLYAKPISTTEPESETIPEETSSTETE